MRKYHADHPLLIAMSKKERRLSRRMEVFEAYGGHCVHCGDDRPEVLTIDHIEGGGNRHRKALKRNGDSFYTWIKKQGYPKEGYRLLCYNCNIARAHRGMLPPLRWWHPLFRSLRAVMR